VLCQQKLSFKKPAEIAPVEAQQAPLQCQRSGVKEIESALYSEPAKEFVKYSKVFVDEVTSVKLAEAQGLRRSNRRGRCVSHTGRGCICDTPRCLYTSLCVAACHHTLSL
jgi:hypothetical protein